MNAALRAWRRRGSDGYNLVILAVSITILNIMLALALPAWSTLIRREKEKELIFRGLQYAEAVRVFQLRNSRLPTRITELIEVEPRSIRQLWHNPVMEDGSWLLVPAQGQPGQPGGQGRQGRQGRQVQPAQPDQNGRPRPGQPRSLRVIPPRPGEPVLAPMPNMPFTGVASPEGETALKTFMGSNEITEWRFTMEMVSAMQQSPDLSFARPRHSGMFWRPFPPGVTPPNMGGQAGAQGGQMNRGGRGGGRNQPNRNRSRTN